MSPHRYPDTDISALERAIRERRDMRHFLPDPLPVDLFERLPLAAVLFEETWKVDAGGTPPAY